jgi:PKD repeat protein
MDPRPAFTNETVTFDASESENATRYYWDLDGDGVTDARGQTVERTYNESGEREIWLYVERQNGGNDSERKTLRVRSAGTPTPTPTATPTPTRTPTPTPTTNGTGGAAGGGSRSTPTPTAASSSATSPSSNHSYTIQELRRDGRHPADAPPSVRQAEEQMFWLIHWPAKALWADVGNPQDDERQFVGEDGPVTGTSVWLRTINPSGTDELTLRVVSYQLEEQTRETDNGVTTETVIASLEERTVDVELAAGWSIVEIGLPDLDEDRRILIYADEHPDQLRWTFVHEPVATSQSAAISTEGDYLWRLGKDVFFPALFGLLIVGLLVRAAIERAGAGPQWGIGQWAGLMGVTGFVGFMWGPVKSAADLLVWAPTVLALILVAVAGIVALETWEDGAQDILFVQPDVEEVISASGKEARDAIVAAGDDELVVDMPDGSTAIVRPGPLKFLARVFGEAAKVRGADVMKTAVELEGSQHDQLVFVQPESEDVDIDSEPTADEDADLEDEEDLEDAPEFEEWESDPSSAINYRPEGWDFGSPDLETWDGRFKAAAVGIAITLGGFAVYNALGVWFAIGGAGAAAAVWLARPIPGAATFQPAPGHLRSAMITAMVMSSDVAEAETLDEARQQNIRLRAQSERDVEAALADQDATLTEALLRGGTDADALERSVVEGVDVDGSTTDGDHETDNEPTADADADGEGSR